MVQVSTNFHGHGFVRPWKCTQVLPDDMGVVRKALREMQPHVVACGPVGAEKPDEVSYQEHTKARYLK